MKETPKDDERNADIEIENIGEIPIEVTTDLTESLNEDLDSDLRIGHDDDIAAVIEDSDIDPADSPVLSEYIALMQLGGVLRVGLTLGYSPSDAEIRDHVETMRRLWRGLLPKLVELLELVADAGIDPADLDLDHAAVHAAEE